MKPFFLTFFLFGSLLVLAQNREHAFEINAKLGRGINYGNMFEAPSENDWGNPWKPEYAGMIAEENKSGTIEMLLTKPISEWQVVWGKFLATLILICIALVLTIPYYITVWTLGPIDHGAVWTGYLGLILMSGAYISIGLFASTLTNNQIVAFLLALFIGVFFHLIFGFLASSMSGIPASVLDYLSLSTHFESISRGAIDSKDIIYFLSLIFIGVAVAEANLVKGTVN